MIQFDSSSDDDDDDDIDAATMMNELSQNSIQHRSYLLQSSSPTHKQTSKSDTLLHSKPLSSSSTEEISITDIDNPFLKRFETSDVRMNDNR